MARMGDHQEEALRAVNQSSRISEIRLSKALIANKRLQDERVKLLDQLKAKERVAASSTQAEERAKRENERLRAELEKSKKKASARIVEAETRARQEAQEQHAANAQLLTDTVNAERRRNLATIHDYEDRVRQAEEELQRQREHLDNVVNAMRNSTSSEDMTPTTAYKQPREYVALYAYTPAEAVGDDTHGELALREGDIVIVNGPVRRDGLVPGTVNGVVGLVPFGFLEPILGATTVKHGSYVQVRQMKLRSQLKAAANVRGGRSAYDGYLARTILRPYHDRVRRKHAQYYDNIV